MAECVCFNTGFSNTHQTIYDLLMIKDFSGYMKQSFYLKTKFNMCVQCVLTCLRCFEEPAPSCPLVSVSLLSAPADPADPIRGMNAGTCHLDPCVNTELQLQEVGSL